MRNPPDLASASKCDGRILLAIDTEDPLAASVVSPFVSSAGVVNSWTETVARRLARIRIGCAEVGVFLGQNTNICFDLHVLQCQIANHRGRLRRTSRPSQYVRYGTYRDDSCHAVRNLIERQTVHVRVDPEQS